jgi:hypothetical protein
METQLLELIKEFETNSVVITSPCNLDLPFYKKKCVAYFMPEFNDEKVKSTFDTFWAEAVQIVKSLAELDKWFNATCTHRETKLVNLSNGIFKIEHELMYQLDPHTWIKDDAIDNISSQLSKTISLRISGKLYQSLRLLMAEHDFDNLSDFVRDYLKFMIIGPKIVEKK